MTTFAAARLPETLQRLVDARLDTIDRMLLGRVDRQDRLAIVREVEAQIHENLQGRDPASLDRDEVLAILARLDPPEAYLPEEPGESPTGAWPPSIPRTGSTDRRNRSRASQASGVLGLVSITMIFVSVGMFLIGELSASMEITLVITFGAIGVTFLLGVLAFSLAAYARLRGAWAIVGLVTGVISTITAIGSGLTLLMMI